MSVRSDTIDITDTQRMNAANLNGRLIEVAKVRRGLTRLLP